MTTTRRTLLLAALAGGAVIAAPTLVIPAFAAAGAAAIRLGVLRYGTLSWELDVISRHRLDAAAGIVIEAVALAGSQATQVAMQAGRVDVTVQDWLWVARQRADGANWTAVPFSSAIGALIAPPASPVRSVADLAGRRLGIAGSPLDKSWLILRAYATQRLGLDLDRAAEKNFGAPPLLAQELAAGRLDAALTYWPFVARAEATGMRRVLAVETAMQGLGIAPGVPVTGYVFSATWAAANRAAIDGFLAAARNAQAILATDDAEWQTIGPLTGAANDAELTRLRDYYRRGIPGRWDQAAQAAAAQMFALLAGVGGTALVGSATAIPPGTFWQTEPL